MININHSLYLIIIDPLPSTDPSIFKIVTFIKKSLPTFAVPLVTLIS